jgi:Ca2+-transporting ATPase
MGHGLWHRVLFLGAVVTAVCLVVGLGARAVGSPWQTVLFLSLLAAQLGVVLGLRSRLFTRENPFLPLSVLVSAALGVAAVYVPFLRSVLETRPLEAMEVGLACATGLLGFAAARLSRLPWLGRLTGHAAGEGRPHPSPRGG